MSMFSKFDMNQLRESIACRKSEELKNDKDLAEFTSTIDEKYLVIINDVPVSFINPALVKSKNVNDNDVSEIKKLHISRIELFEMMSLTSPEDPDSKPFFEECVAMLKDIEFLLQKHWGFDEDEDFHVWWFIAPHCTCPKIDNAERIGTKYRIINQSCPLHGSSCQNK